MQTFRIIIIVSLLFTAFGGKAQQPDAILKYIETYRHIAILEMQRTGVPAAIKLAQGIHETTAGTSILVKKSNNHFGIKCKSTWTGESVSHTDDAPNECFRKYEDPLQSYRDHSDFLKGSSRYASLFNLDPQDYEGWAYGLKKAGYATNPKYPQIIIRLIETYKLQDYTLVAMGKLSPPEGMIAGNDAGQEGNTEISSLSEKNNSAFETIAAPLREYPNGDFKINDTKVIYARSGTPVLSIAQQYHVPLSRIFDFNEMTETETLQKDQLIYLQRKRKTGENEVHIVRKGETLHDIAQCEAIRLESLLEYNYLQVYMQPAVGEQLFLRRKALAMPRLEKNELAKTGRWAKAD